MRTIRDGPLLFWQGGGGRGEGLGNFHREEKHYFMSPFSCKHFFFYLHTIYFSVYSLCNQLFQNFQPPPSRQKNNGPSFTESGHEKSDSGIGNFFFFHKIRQQKTNVLVARLYYATVKFLLRQFFSF